MFLWPLLGFAVMYHQQQRVNRMGKDLNETIRQIQVMSGLAKKAHVRRSHELQGRIMGDLDRLANSAWLNLYEFLADNGIDPDEHILINKDK